jgi:hypothetical protein
MSLLGLFEEVLILLRCMGICVEDLFLRFLSSKVEAGAVSGTRKR